MAKKNVVSPTIQQKTKSLLSYDILNRDRNMENYIRYVLNRTLNMFTYEGLPDTIPVRELEKLLQINGSCGIIKHNDKLYAVVGGLGGLPNVYYEGTIYTVANPALNLSKAYKVNLEEGNEAVYTRNDSLSVGLLPLIQKYCFLRAENDISFRMYGINTRSTFLLSSADDRAYLAAQKYLSDIEHGKLGVVAETPFLDGIKSQPLSQGSQRGANEFIETEQYLKSALYNELGLPMNGVMKKERLITDEVTVNNESLKTLVDDMLHQREVMCDEIKELFDVEITVKLNGAWHDVEILTELATQEEPTKEEEVTEETQEEVLEGGTEENEEEEEEDNE